VIIFVSKTGNNLNRTPFDIEHITTNLCMNPMYPRVSTAIPCTVLLDSGAYQDKNKPRVTFQQAYDRQVEFQRKLGYRAKYIAAYDMIGNKEQTMMANNFLLGIQLPPLQQRILIVQGDIKEEYSTCLHDLLALSKTNSFVLGFGGISRISRSKKLQEKLQFATSENRNEFNNIIHIHLFGVLSVKMLKWFEQLFPNHFLSCDTAGIELKSVHGVVFNNGVWVKQFCREQKYIDYHPCTLAKENIRKVVEYFGEIE